MAKIEKIKKGTATIYPATIPQAVVDPTSGKSAREELDEKANHGYDSAPKTLKAVDEAKVDKTSIIGETGQGETSVMHQKAVTDELAKKAEHGYAAEETPKTVKEIDDSVSQLASEVSVKIKNLVINGDFNSSEGWTATLQGTIVDGELVITTLSAPPWEQSINASIGDMVYFGGILYTLSGAGYNNTPFIRLTDSGPSTMLSNPTEIPTRVSGVRTIAGDGVLIRLNGQYSGAVDHHFDKIFAINLTETFGVGSEPTKEEFELLLDILGTDYFEGEITIPAQKIMQWQLALIRKNKNAIIALGGTII